jgi:predicted nuclease with TOPRIM domain
MLIEIFTDFIRSRKDLREYIALRKTIQERGEFNDATLIKIQEKLERLQQENPQIYEKMYAVLEAVFENDAGQRVDYPLDFAREVLKMFKNSSLEAIYEEYKAILEHKYQTQN